MGVLVGYAEGTPGYRVWDPTTHLVWDVREPEFNEEVVAGWWKKPPTVKENIGDIDEPLHFEGLDSEEESTEESVTPAGGDGIGVEEEGPPSVGGSGLLEGGEGSREQEGAQEPRRSNRENRGVPPLRFIEMLEAAAEAVDGGSPATYKEALSGPEAARWKGAFEAEMRPLKENGMYMVVDRPRGKKVVKSKWVCRKKVNPDGTVDKYKAGCVAKGFTQREGVDYGETFSLTIRHESIRMMAAAAAAEGLHAHQMDVTTAFLYVNLDEEVYMGFVDGMEGAGVGNKVARLWKSIYGLKQASRMWNLHIDEILRRLGFHRLSADHGVYVRWDGVNRVWLALYVDDILLTGKNLAKIQETKKVLGADMKVKDLGEVRYLLGIEVRRRRQFGDMRHGDILLVQEKYVRDMLVRYEMVDCKPATTPLEPNVKMSEMDCPTSDLEKDEMEKFPYRSVVGILMYLSVCTRPDICQAVGELNRFNNNPGRVH